MPEVDKTIRGLTAFLECNSRKCDGCEYQDKKPGMPGGCKLDQYQVLEDALDLLKEQQNQIWEFQDQVEYLTDKLKEHETELCDRCGRRRLKSNRVEGL